MADLIARLKAWRPQLLVTIAPFDAVWGRYRQLLQVIAADMAGADASLVSCCHDTRCPALTVRRCCPLGATERRAVCTSSPPPRLLIASKLPPVCLQLAGGSIDYIHWQVRLGLTCMFFSSGVSACCCRCAAVASSTKLPMVWHTGPGLTRGPCSRGVLAAMAPLRPGAALLPASCRLHAPQVYAELESPDTTAEQVRQLPSLPCPAMIPHCADVMCCCAFCGFCGSLSAQEAARIHAAGRCCLRAAGARAGRLWQADAGSQHR